jgi:hypothetical protein
MLEFDCIKVNSRQQIFGPFTSSKAHQLMNDTDVRLILPLEKNMKRGDEGMCTKTWVIHTPRVDTNA